MIQKDVDFVYQSIPGQIFIFLLFHIIFYIQNAGQIRILWQMLGGTV